MMFIKGRKIMINMEAIKTIKIKRFEYCFKVVANDFDNEEYNLFIITGDLTSAIKVAKALINSIYIAKTHSIDVDLKNYCELSKEGYKELTGMDKIDVDIFTAI